MVLKDIYSSNLGAGGRHYRDTGQSWVVDGTRGILSNLGAGGRHYRDTGQSGVGGWY